MDWRVFEFSVIPLERQIASIERNPIAALVRI